MIADILNFKINKFTIHQYMKNLYVVLYLFSCGLLAAYLLWVENINQLVNLINVIFVHQKFIGKLSEFQCTHSKVNCY